MLYIHVCLLVFVRAACVAGANAECWANGCGPTVPVSKNAVVLSHLYIETIILPRQARDKHRESTQKRPFRCSYAFDGTLITPLTTGEFAAQLGSGDKLVQAYNFRLCTTENRSNQVKQKNAIFAPRVC